MLRDTILKQKKEKEYLLSLPYIERNKLATNKKWLSSDLVKVILGPRRAGKSVFSLMLLRDNPFAYFNFEDESLPNGEELNLDKLMQELQLVYGQTAYILFDEIQNLPRWELFINRLHRKGYNLILTGSNANLLSKELATALTGRHIPIEILPFDFTEFMRANQYEVTPEKLSLPEERARLLKLVERYATAGSYPEVVTKGVNSQQYLEVLFDSLLY